MGSFQGKKYDVLEERTYQLGSVSNQAYTSGNLFASNLTAPVNGYISVRALSSVDKNVGSVVLNGKSGFLFPDLNNGEMKLNVWYSVDIPVVASETINFTFSKAANISLVCSFTGIVS